MERGGAADASARRVDCAFPGSRYVRRQSGRRARAAHDLAGSARSPEAFARPDAAVMAGTARPARPAIHADISPIEMAVTGGGHIQVNATRDRIVPPIGREPGL